MYNLINQQQTKKKVNNYQTIFITSIFFPLASIFVEWLKFFSFFF